MLFDRALNGDGVTSQHQICTRDIDLLLSFTPTRQQEREEMGTPGSREAAMLIVAGTTEAGNLEAMRGRIRPRVILTNGRSLSGVFSFGLQADCSVSMSSRELATLLRVWTDIPIVRPSMTFRLNSRPRRTRFTGLCAAKSTWDTFGKNVLGSWGRPQRSAQTGLSKTRHSR